VDRPATNRKFALSLELDYPILSDPTRRTARAYGVLRLGLFAARRTFVIGMDGRILDVLDEVRCASAGADLVARFEATGVPRV